jgi:hypothetical protein
MAVYRPQYTDKKTGEMKHTKIWYYEFIFAVRLVKESAKTHSKTVAKLAEQARRRELEKGFNGVSDERPVRIRSIKELSAVSCRLPRASAQIGQLRRTRSPPRCSTSRRPDGCRSQR